MDLQMNFIRTLRGFGGKMKKKQQKHSYTVLIAKTFLLTVFLMCQTP